MSDGIVLTVNGKAHTVLSAADTPLLYVLRNELGLNGPHFGCGGEKCGACMVLVGAKPELSCHLPISQIGRSRITTLEGLIEEGELHPVQSAFQAHHGLQCGYCTPGMVLAAVSLLAENPAPTEEEVRLGLEGNLCRCTGYQNIVKAVLAAAQTQGVDA